jgi:hypothetical protein
VYVHQWGHSGISGGSASQYPYVTGLNESSGAIAFATSHSGQWSSGSRPTVAGSQVFAAGGYYGGLDAYNGIAGGIQWFAKVNQQYGWIPAADSERVYVYMGSASASPGPPIGTFYAFNRSNGGQAFTILNTDDQFTRYNGTVFVGDQNDAFAFSRGQGGLKLVSFDLLNRTVRWRVAGNFSGALAIDDGIIFAANGIELTLFDEATGNKLDSWFAPPGEALQRNLLVTENLIFLGTAEGTYGLDRSSLEIVWQSDLTGDLAFGEDMLFISTTSAIYAFAVPEPGSSCLVLATVSLIAFHRRRLPGP